MHTERVLQNAKRNPFYLLSAFSMLLGCFALSHQLTLVPGQWKPIVVLIGVLQVYEFLLLALALYLNRRRNAPADAATLFFLGLLFLVDATHLNAELAASDGSIATLVAAALWLLAAIKLDFVRSALGLTSRRALALAMAGLSLILFLPVVVRWVHFMDRPAPGSGAEALVMYGLWWLVGSIPIAWLWAEREPGRSQHLAARWMVRALSFLPLVSLVLHLLSLHWVYDLTFHASYAAPVLLGLSTYLSIAAGEWLDEYRPIVRWGAPLVVLLLSSNGAEALSSSWDAPWLLPVVVFSPLRLALLGLALAWLLHHVLTREKSLAWAAAGSVLMALSGHSASSMRRSWAAIVPDTAAELGLVSILAAFALLAFGFAKSLVLAREDMSRSRRMRSDEIGSH